MIFDMKHYLKLLEDRNVEAIAYFIECVPDYLIKFYSLSDDASSNEKRFKKLRSNANWFDIPEHQNDPFDMKMAYVDEEIAKEKGACDEAVMTAKSLLNGLQNGFALCSFIDTDVNNLPMWAFYANNHQGYCVRYKINKKELVFRVLYEPERIGTLGVLLQLYAAMKASDEQKAETKELQLYRHCLFNLINCKHISWKSEKEFRIIFPVEKRCGLNIRNEATGLELTDVYMGINCSTENQERLKEICQKSLHCRLHKGYVSQTKFLEFQEI